MTEAAAPDDLRFGDFTEARWAGRQFEAISLEGAVLVRAELRGARFIAVDLTGCDLEGADLTGAVFERCNLARADLRQARLVRTTLLDNCWDGVTADEVRCEGLVCAPTLPAALAGAAGALSGTGGEVPRSALRALGEARRAQELGGEVAVVRGHLEAVRAVAPAWSRLHRELAELAEREGRRDDAAAAYERAYRAEPRDLRAARRAAQLFVDARDAERALALLSAVHAAQPGDVALLRELGWAASCAGRLREARRALDEAALLLRRRGQVDVDLWLQLASLDVAEGRTQVAFDRLRTAIAHAPERADLWRPFAELCDAHLDAPAPAEAAYARYLAHHAGDLRAWRAQARLRIRLGDAGGALEAIGHGRALPGHAEDDLRQTAELERLRPALLAQAYRYEALAREALGPASEGDWRWGLLLTRAQLALGDPALPAWLARLAARADLDDDARVELGLRRLLVQPAVIDLAEPMAGARSELPASALPDEALAELRAAGLAGEAAPVATAISAYGSLLVAFAEPDGGHALVELAFGERQRAWIAGSLADERCVPGAWRRAWQDGAPDRALRVHGRAVHGARFTPSAEDPPRLAAPAAPDWRAIAHARVDARVDADCLVDLPRATQARFAAAARAAWQRGAGALDRMAVALAHGDTAAWLFGAVRLPSSSHGTAPFAGGAVLGPRWLPPLLAWLALDRQRDQLERYHACGPDARRSGELAAAAATAELGPAELEAAATLFLLGPASSQALAFADAEPALGPPVAALRVATTEAILLRLDVIARGLLAAAIGPVLSTRARAP